jgi:hypothetical protein
MAVLFTIAKIQKQPKHLPAEEWINKSWCIYMMEYYSAFSKNKILPFVTIWMKLKDSLLRNGQIRKEASCTISFVSGI